MKTSSQKVRDWYDQNFEAYLKSGDILIKDVLDEFLSYVLANGKILDMGCGTGRDVGYFNEHGYKAVGVDFSSKMIEHAKKNYPGEFFEKDFADTGFSDDSFNAVWSSSALFTHLDSDEREKALNEVIRILKPNGVFGFILMEKNEKKSDVADDKGHIFNRYTQRELEDILFLKNMKLLLARTFDFHKREWIFCVARIV